MDKAPFSPHVAGYMTHPPQGGSRREGGSNSQLAWSAAKRISHTAEKKRILAVTARFRPAPLEFVVPPWPPPGFESFRRAERSVFVPLAHGPGQYRRLTGRVSAPPRLGPPSPAGALHSCGRKSAVDSSQVCPGIVGVGRAAGSPILPGVARRGARL